MALTRPGLNRHGGHPADAPDRVVAPKSFNTSVDFGMVPSRRGGAWTGVLVADASGLGQVVGQVLEKVLPLSPGRDALNFLLSAMSTLTGIVTTIPGVPTVWTPMAPDLGHGLGLRLPAVLMTQVIGFSTVLFPIRSARRSCHATLRRKLGHLLKITLPLALITFVVLLPLDYLWWKLLGWL